MSSSPTRTPSLTPEESALVTAHVGLARAMARRFTHRGVEIDDLEQVALLALVRLAPRYDPTNGATFSTYAVTCILGELKRYFRDHAWAMRVPRRTQETYLAVKAAAEQLLNEKGRSPTVAELATRLGTEEEAVLEAMEAGQSFWPSSLDVARGDDDEPVVGKLSTDEPGFEAVTDRLLLEEVLPRLGQTEQAIVKYLYFEGWTQRQVGELLGISQMQVSRLLKRLLLKIRMDLTPAD